MKWPINPQNYYKIDFDINRNRENLNNTRKLRNKENEKCLKRKSMS